MSNPKLSRYKLGVLVLPIGSLLCACSRDTVDLGDGTSTTVVARGTRCQDSTLIAESVRVTNQAELEALAGCDEIQGDLRIQFFDGTDLAPLSALHTVGGQLAIGASGTELFVDATGVTLPGEDMAWETAAGSDSLVIQRGWLDSLAGLEGLERVGSLSIASTQVATLEPLANLRSLNSPSFTTSSGGLPGSLSLQSNANLVDLHGLENALGTTIVTLDNNDSLASLVGLQLVSGILDSLVITTDHALTAIDALAPLTTLRTNLVLRGTSVQNLDALSRLRQVPDLQIVDNHALIDASGLSSLQSVQTMLYEGNALQALPSFARIGQDSFRVLEVIGEPEIETVSLDFGIFPQTDAPPLGSRNVRLGTGSIEIGRNTKLQSISNPAGIELLQALFVHHNPALSEIDLASLVRLDMLSIDTNPTLTSVHLGSVNSVDDLELTNNPLLSVSTLANLPTSSSIVYGNADGSTSADGSVPSSAPPSAADPAAAPTEAP